LASAGTARSGEAVDQDRLVTFVGIPSEGRESTDIGGSARPRSRAQSRMIFAPNRGRVRESWSSQEIAYKPRQMTIAKPSINVRKPPISSLL
jgi:hypothetical protein